MPVRDLSAGSVEPEAVVAATDIRGVALRAPFLVLCMGILIVAFQNCAVDLSTSTPGASTSGGCTPTAEQLTASPAAINVLKTNCAGCHASSAGAAAGFIVPEASANENETATQTLAFTFLCSFGAERVATKIDGTGAHQGGVFPRSGPASPLYLYLESL